MTVLLHLSHKLYFEDGWLGFSHADSPPPYQHVNAHGILSPAKVRMANWYFLCDEAREMLKDTSYLLVSESYDNWLLWIEDDKLATLFKLKWG